MPWRRTQTIVLALIAAVEIFTSGCSRMTRTPPVVIGAVAGAPSVEVFDRVIERARAQGYEPEGADVSLGIFRVRAHWTAQGAHHFDVQCFASGHAQLVANGPSVRRDGADSVMPSELRDELFAFAAALAVTRATP